MEAGENDESRGDGAIPRREPAERPKTGFAETLKQLFREAVKHLTSKAPAPQPTPRRRRTTDETGRAFRMAAGKIMRRAVRLPAAAYEAVAFLSDTLDWLNPWHHEAASTHESDDDLQQTQQHLYPHL